MSRDNLRAWVYALAGKQILGRQPGTPSARRIAELLARYFESVGAASADPSGYCVGFEHHSIQDQNVIAHVVGNTKAETGNCWVVVGAHYDALGPDKKGNIRPGADDNATGVAVLLEIARLVGTRAHPLAFGLVLAAFSAEETDLRGSSAYVSSPSVPLDQITLMINVDMVGRKLAGNPGLGYEVTQPLAARTRAWVRAAGKKAGVGVIPVRLDGRGDSASFAPRVPAVFLSTAEDPDYHQATDTPEKVDYDQVTRTARVTLALLDQTECLPRPEAKDAGAPP